MITAREVVRLKGFAGDARLYKLNQVVSFGLGCWTKHVIVSSTIVPAQGPETYIFPASSDGSVISWTEMEGSYKGGLSHKKAIKNAGWALVNLI